MAWKGLIVVSLAVAGVMQEASTTVPEQGVCVPQEYAEPHTLVWDGVAGATEYDIQWVTNSAVVGFDRHAQVNCTCAATCGVPCTEVCQVELRRPSPGRVLYLKVHPRR